MTFRTTVEPWRCRPLFKNFITMIPSNVDSRRPDKVQRYKPSQANGNAPGDDLTPDYMNILGPESTTANAEAPVEMTEEQRPEQPETWPTVTANSVSETPISPQYGIANLPSTTTTTANDIPCDTTTPATDTITETTAKTTDGDNKDLHSTPSRNDRFKVVKIASLEPFRRGRWKCMDYVDQTAPTTTTAIKSTQSTGTMPLYMHTQSLPQQQIQQMLVQGNYGNQPYYNVPSQMLPPNQFFYSTQPLSNIQTQNLQQQIGVTPGNVQPTVFISTTQPYIQQSVPNSVGGFTVQAYPNVQYVPSNLSQNQGSAFIPTSQNVNAGQLSSNFQQSQSYAGQPTVSQPNIGQPIVNGHAFPQQNDQVSTTLPTQIAKIAILNSQPTNIQNQVPQNMAIPTNPPQQIQAVPVQTIVPNQQYNQQMQNANYQAMQAQMNQGNHQIQQNMNHQVTTNVTTVNPIPTSNPSASQIPPVQTTVNQNPTSASQVASVNPQQQQQQINPIHSANIQTMHQIVPQIIPIVPTATIQPQFVASVGNLVAAETKDIDGNRDVAGGISEIPAENATGEDTSKPPNPVPQVNAIDNKIEQAMDLVKSHLMYTVREEVEILKEKITELMAKIQQLESENSFLKTQIPNLNPNGTPDPPQ
ncbi:PAT complex subunit Asterix [Popillia japonica]|uniref:PAT complex subunit Asterix n=1 Tax=Popillia japonica TaxID=7064 RepID=A0AAW1L7S9_POPJA